MSALTLLSVIAPAVPAVPQGPSDEAVSGFRNLLAALSGEALATPGTKAGQTAPAALTDPNAATPRPKTDPNAPAIEPGAALAPKTIPIDLGIAAVAPRVDLVAGASPSGEDAAPSVRKSEPADVDASEAGVVTPDKAEAVAIPGPAELLVMPVPVPVMPAPPPTPVVLPATEEAPVAPATTGSTEGNGEIDADASAPPPVVAETGDGPEVARTTVPLPVDKSPAPKTNEPQVQPPTSDFRAYRDEVRAPLLVTVAQTAAALEAIDARARTSAPPAPPAPSAPSMPSTPPPVVPASTPLRPLAERASRPLETSVGKTGDGPRVADPVVVAPTAVTAAMVALPVAGAQSPGPADLLPAAAAAREASAETGEMEAPTSDLPPLGEGASAQAQTPAAARETGLPTLSRATIEATAQIAAQILRRLEGRSTRFEMALTPDELGRVDVRLDIDSEGRLNARLAFDNPAAATDLRGRADELRRQLEDAGFHLAEDAFEFAERDSGSSAFDRGQDARNGSTRAFAAATRLSTEADIAQPPRWQSVSLSPSGVDMKV